MAAKIRLFTVPNIITLANLACGSAAAVYALGGDLKLAFWLIAVAAVFDFLDGFAARLLRQYSEIGKQLDSLSDMVSFGVAPSAILYSMFLDGGGDPVVGFAVFIIALFSALRLAKFNIDESQSHEFHGLPTPACALFVASGGWLYAEGAFLVWGSDMTDLATGISPLWLIVVAVILSILLVSNFRMFALKFSGYGFKGNEVRYIFLALALIAIAIFRIAAIPFAIFAYILTSLVLNIARGRG
jgi:CDP-diacylglycerol--serine O-phosphatidyltransferase